MISILIASFLSVSPVHADSGFAASESGSSCFRVWNRGSSPAPTSERDIPPSAGELLVTGRNVADVTDPAAPPYFTELQGAWSIELRDSNGNETARFSATDLKLGHRSGTVNRTYDRALSLMQFDLGDSDNDVGSARIAGRPEMFYFRISCR
ncbi:MAG: hypothetical protein ACXVCH_17065 [Bdellovibrionota bacterium]